MTVADVSAATRIRGPLIEALEADDHGPSGGLAYARGHMRSVCAVIGVPAASVLALLERPSPVPGPTPPATTTPAEPPRDRGPATSLGDALASTGGAGAMVGRGKPNWSGVMAATLALIVAFGAYTVVRSGADATPAAIAPTTSALPPGSSVPSPSAALPTSKSAPSPTTPPTTPEPSPTDQVVARADGVTVEVSVSGSASWILASAGSTKLYEGILFQGQRKTFRDAKKVSVIFGNAGAVRLTVNGVTVGAPGGKGQVVKTSFGPGDPAPA